MTDDPIARLIADLDIIAPPDGWVARATDRHERTMTMNTIAIGNNKAQDTLNRARVVASLAIDYGDHAIVDGHAAFSRDLRLDAARALENDATGSEIAISLMVDAIREATCSAPNAAIDGPAGKVAYDLVTGRAHASDVAKFALVRIDAMRRHQPTDSPIAWQHLADLATIINDRNQPGVQ